MKKQELLRWIQDLERWMQSRAEINDRGLLSQSDLRELKQRLQTLIIRLPQ